MKTIKMLVWFSLLLTQATIAFSQSLVLSKQTARNTSILIATDASPACQKAANELQKYIKKTISIDIPVVEARNTSGQIIIGQGKFINSYAPEINLAKLNTDGYTILTKGKDLIIAGGSGKGALFAVYTLLEKYFGCRMYTANVMKLPQRNSVTLSSINLTEVPKLVLRDVFYLGAMDSVYSDWHKLIHARNTYSSFFGIFAHTGFQIMPPKQYFSAHPEYYSLVNGKRQASQLDPTNKDVYSIVQGWLNAKIKNQPQYNFWSVSIEDNGSYCQCEYCQQLIKETKSPGGPAISFANRLAQFFPKETISALAYSYTRNPPQNIKLAPNLNIMYCPSVKNYVTDYNSPAYADMRQQVDGWLNLTKNIFVWDYVIDYGALESIYPNLYCLKPNLQYFIKKGATGYFAEGNIFPDGEFAELRAYLLSKLTWDPNVDDDAVITDFLQGYYGPAAPSLKKYIQLTSQQLTGGPDKLTENMITTYDNLFEQAKSSVKNQPDLLKRVQKEKIALEYSAIQFYLKDAEQNSDQFFANQQKSAKFNKYMQDFLSSVQNNGIRRLIHNENNIPMKQFYMQWKNKMGDIQSKSLLKKK
ncbi:DUF4838 domain-containing protein [Chitinophaga ginsengisegetis]|uniref:DUF4838 domain-containing protein n=1 Tax=Chitinophaga ginsengisegetis TaxID=393003 RepID=UPI00341203D3